MKKLIELIAVAVVAWILAFVIVGATIAVGEFVQPSPPPLLVRADYQRCLTVKTGPIIAPKPAKPSPVSELT